MHLIVHQIINVNFAICRYGHISLLHHYVRCCGAAVVSAAVNGVLRATTIRAGRILILTLDA